MTGLQIYAFIVLPFLIAAAGWIYSYIVVRNDRRKNPDN